MTQHSDPGVSRRGEPRVEALSAELHAIYQREARRQANTGDDTVRHPDDYDALPEHTKEYDRVLARFILARLDDARADNARLREELESAKAELQAWRDARDEGVYL